MKDVCFLKFYWPVNLFGLDPLVLTTLADKPNWAGSLANVFISFPSIVYVLCVCLSVLKLFIES